MPTLTYGNVLERTSSVTGITVIGYRLEVRGWKLNVRCRQARTSVANDNPGNRTYTCSSGEITIAVTTAEQWHALAVCLGRPELSYEGAWDVVRQAAADGAVARVVGEMFSEDTAESWKRRLDAHGVSCVTAPS
jgi:crotonobetainyl-CoA:carnitine CoA-transferase CaiB-like acyl-CoA transferase